MPSCVEAPISWNVRATVVPEGTEPNRSAPNAEALDIEAALAAASEDERHLREDLPPVVKRDAPVTPADPRREGGAQAQPTSDGAEGVQPDVGHDPFPPDSTLTRRVLSPFTWEVPFWSGACGFEHLQFPLPEGSFRGWAPLSSNGRVTRLG